MQMPEGSLIPPAVVCALHKNEERPQYPLCGRSSFSYSPITPRKEAGRSAIFIQQFYSTGGTVILTTSPQPDRWRTEPDVRNVQIAIRSERHRRRKKQSAGYFLRAFVGHAKHFAGEWSRKQIVGGVLQHVHVAIMIESYTEHCCKSLSDRFQLSTRRNLQDFRPAFLDWKSIQVSHVKGPVICHSRRHDVSLRCRNVCYPSDLAGRRNPVELAVVRLDRVQICGPFCERSRPWGGIGRVSGMMLALRLSRPGQTIGGQSS